jgi:hypothetical protein
VRYGITHRLTTTKLLNWHSEETVHPEPVEGRLAWLRLSEARTDVVLSSFKPMLAEPGSHIMEKAQPLDEPLDHQIEPFAAGSSQDQRANNFWHGP